MLALVYSLILLGAPRCSSSVLLSAHQPAPQTATQPGDDLTPKKDSETDRDQGDHNPGLQAYRAQWSERYLVDKHLREPMSASIKLVLGIMTIPGERDYRAVVRQTWLNQTGVCSLEASPREGCSVYAAFIMGKSGWGTTWRNQPLALPHGWTAEDVEATRREPGVLLLDIEENMNNGKSALWFMTALRRFPWATHIGKLDMDTFPFLHKLVHRMAEGRNGTCPLGPYEFIGRPYDNHGGIFSSSCPRESCDRFAPQDVWSFMGGAFYALSTPLVGKLSWEKAPTGGEDGATNWLVQRASKQQGFCVVPRALDSWYHSGIGYHGGGASDPDYANRF